MNQGRGCMEIIEHMPLKSFHPLPLSYVTSGIIVDAENFSRQFAGTPDVMQSLSMSPDTDLQPQFAHVQEISLIKRIQSLKTQCKKLCLRKILF